MENIESPDKVSMVQLKIAEIARKYGAVDTLNHHLTQDWLHEAYRRTRKGGATGIDGKDSEEFAEKLLSNLDDLVNQAKSGKYRAPAVRRTHIPKSGNELRSLGIPTFSDKVLQRGCLMLLEPVFETIFYDCSYGFRPGKSAHDCIRSIRDGLHELQGCYVLDVDIRKYFDTIPHSTLRSMVEEKVKDGMINRLIAKWLKAGVMENGNVSFSDIGTPQGGVISPLLSNVYLHTVLDEWYHTTVVNHTKGRTRLYRFADDFIILCKSKHDADKIMAALVKRFAKYGLEIHPTKTKIVDFNKPKDKDRHESFNFLGFTFYWGLSRNGNRLVRLKTENGRFTRSLKRLHDLCRMMQHWSIKDQVARLNRSLRGHYNYYGVSFNQRGVWSLRYFATRIWRYWLNRRSQKRRMPWYKFKRILATVKIAYPTKMVTLW